ncbi:MAG: 50S ribosomal protein L5 [Candidatus Liptonbacteria bacterium]|nr:50S ribosomal protein L5 [Candidatus Liptonbacteria bacterium]
MGRLSSEPQFSEKILPAIIKDVGLITGQKPKHTTAKKSIAGFKTRTGQVIGVKATLRGSRARDFLDRLMHTALPRVKDFRGIDLKNVDELGNLNLGVREHLAFPQVNPEESPYNFGFQISVVLRAVKNRSEAIDLYRRLGVPLKK